MKKEALWCKKFEDFAIENKFIYIQIHKLLQHWINKYKST